MGRYSATRNYFYNQRNDDCCKRERH